MYELPVDGNAADTRWVAEGGNGDYFVGRFDGTTFTPESEKLTCDNGSHYYAGQTFSDVPASDGRRIQIAWMNSGNLPGMLFTNQMSFPRELTLVTTQAGIRMVRRPVREIETIRGREWKFENLALRPGENPLAGIEDELLEIQATIEVGSAAKVGLRLRDESIRYSTADHRLRCLARSAPLEAKGGLLDLRILLDRTTVEIFADGGLVTMASCFLPEPNDRSLEIYAKGGEARIVSMHVWELKSTWK